MMELTYSEIFLGVWAVIATILAVAFRHEALKAHFIIVKSMLLIKDVAEGEASLEIVDGHLKVNQRGN